MRKHLPYILVIVILAALAFITIAGANKADAATVKSIGGCKYTGVVNSYYHAGDQITVNVSTPNTFETYRCLKGPGLRIYKSVANTWAEVADLKLFAQENDKTRFKMAWCETDETHAHIIDLAWFYRGAVQRVNQAEKRHYSGWLERYATNHGCEIY